MKLIKMTVMPKVYNFNDYNEYTFQLRDGNFNRIVKTTGRTELVLVDLETGEELSTGKLDDYATTLIPTGCNMEFWFDLLGKISRIDVHCPANPAGSDTPIK